MSRRFFSFSPFLWKLNRSLQTMTINYSIRLQILFFFGDARCRNLSRERLQFSTRRKCLFDDKERSSRRPSLSPLFTSSKQYSILLPTNERNIAREKVREKEEKGNYYYYYCYLEKLPGNSTRVKGKKGEFFLFYKILVNNCGAIARGAKKKKGHSRFTIIVSFLPRLAPFNRCLPHSTAKGLLRLLLRRW